MDYSLFHNEHEQFRQQVRRYLLEKVAPNVEEWGETSGGRWGVSASWVSVMIPPTEAPGWTSCFAWS